MTVAKDASIEWQMNLEWGKFKGECGFKPLHLGGNLLCSKSSLTEGMRCQEIFSFFLYFFLSLAYFMLTVMLINKEGKLVIKSFEQGGGGGEV